MTLPYLVIIGVVSRRHLHRTAPHFRIGIVICHNGNGAIHKRQHHHFTHGIAPSHIGWMHRHPGIAQHGFRARCRHNHIGRVIYPFVPNMPQVAIDLSFLHLEIGNHSATLRAPVHHAFAPINPALLVKTHKCFQHRLHIFLIHCKSLARPVITTAQLAQLSQNCAAVFFPPGPYPFQQISATNFAARLLFGLPDLLLHLHLRANTRVIRTGQTQCAKSPHPLIPNHRVVNRVL